MSYVHLSKRLIDNASIAIKRYNNHPNLAVTSRLVTRKGFLSFNQVSYGRTEKLIRNLDNKKVFQDTDILIRITKEKILISSFTLY